MRLVATIAMLGAVYGGCCAQTAQGGVSMSGGVALSNLSGGGGGTTASVSMTSDSASMSMGSVVVGEPSTAGVITVTNGTGSDFTWRQWADAVNQGTSGNQGTLQFDGDAVAKSWGDSCNPGYLGGANPGTWTFINHSTCQINAYLEPSATGASMGHIYLKDLNGNNLSTITLSGTGIADTNSTVALPTGIASDYSGTVMSTTYPGDGTCNFTVTTATQLTTALSTVDQGQVICITLGSSLSGNFTLRDTGHSASTIIIRADQSGSLPSGIPAAGHTICLPNGLATNYNSNCATMAANMAKIANALDPSGTPTFTVSNGNQPYRLVGLELTGSETLTCQPGSGSHIILDRLYIHDNGLSGFGNVQMYCPNIAMIDSWDESDSLSEIQVFAIGDGSVVTKVVNNVIIGTGGIISGGEIGRASVVQPTDIEVRGNHFFRPVQWDPYCIGGTLPSWCNGVSWDGNSRAGGAKSMLEFKEGQRILDIGNIIEQSFSEQLYAPYLFSPGDQHGNNIFATVRDATSVRNIVRYSNSGLFVTAGAFTWPGLETKRIYVADHLSYGICGSTFPSAWAGGNGGNCSALAVDAEKSAAPLTRSFRPVLNLTFEHNTMLDFYWSPYTGAEQNAVDASNFSFRNNILGTGAHVNLAEVDMAGGAGSSVQLNGTASNALSRNAMFDPIDPSFISGGTWTFNWGASGAWNSFFVYGGAQSNAGFNNAPSDYTLSVGSAYHNWAADGTDPGIRSAVYTSTACVATGTCNPLP